MPLDKVRIGQVELTRLAIGGNPFSGCSHQGLARDKEMRRYYTAARIKETLHKAEASGINTLFARVDAFVTRLLEEYWNEGGKIQWFAQTAPEMADPFGNIRLAADFGAKGCYLHGGQTDFSFHKGNLDIFPKALELIRSLGMAGGFAGHACEPHAWIRDNLQSDFQMCCYYNPSARQHAPQHVSTLEEKWDPAHRDRMAGLIQSLRVPAVHYKVLAAGHTPVRESLEYVAKAARPQDVVLLGMFLGDDPDMIDKNVKLFEEIVQGAGQKAHRPSDQQGQRPVAS